MITPRYTTAEVDSMKRQELLQAANAMFEGHTTGNPWIHQTNENIRKALETGELPADIANPAPAAAGTAASTDEEQLLRALHNVISRRAPAAATAAALDEGAVMAIVEKALATHKKTVEIQLPGKAPQVVGLCHDKYPTILQHVACRDSVYLVGPAGTGKTHMAEQLSQTLELAFSALSCGPTTDKLDFLGYMDAAGTYHRTAFRDRFEHGGVFCLDEIDNAGDDVLTMLNAALSNGYCLFPDGMIRRHADFVVVACANTYGTGGTAEYADRVQLGRATLDRFSQILVPIDHALELALAKQAVPTAFADLAAEWVKAINNVRNADREGLISGASTRTIISGAKLIAAGLPVDHVAAARLWRGAPEMTVKRLKELVSLAQVAAVYKTCRQAHDAEQAPAAPAPAPAPAPAAAPEPAPTENEVMTAPVGRMIDHEYETQAAACEVPF